MIESATETTAPPAVSVHEETDPEVCAAWNAQRARADRNRRWLRANFDDIADRHCGQFVCVAGEKLFASDSPAEAYAAAKAKHPDDDGRICEFIPTRPGSQPLQLRPRLS